MKKRIRLAPIIREAANKYLWDGVSDIVLNPNLRNFSCTAIGQACNISNLKVRNTIDNHLENCGLHFSSWGSSTFREFEYGEERQGVRYAWLNLFADYLEEIDARATVVDID